MSFFNTSASFRHASALPAGTDKAHAIARLLHDHAFFVQCDPHAVDCVRVEADEAAQLATQTLAEDDAQTHPLPAAVRSRIEASEFSVYRITDVVHTLPAGLWDSRVVSTYEMTNTAGGVHVRIRSPMSVVMDTVWSVAERDGDDNNVSDAAPASLELVEDISIYCSRLLMGTVRGLCDAGWTEIHAKMAGHLAEKETSTQ